MFQMLALSCLDKLIELDPHTSWVSFLSSHGYLKHLIDSLLDSDEKLLSVLETVPTTLRPLYLYESKMVSSFQNYSKYENIDSSLPNMSVFLYSLFVSSL